MSTKEKVREKLMSSHEHFVSGEELASFCNVSRTAVWKAINSLKEDGFEIESVTNNGYRILSYPDRLNQAEIKSILTQNNCEFSDVFVFDSIGSTNSEAKRRAVQTGSFRNANGTLTEQAQKLNKSLFAAETQTAGRGRMNRVFVSTKYYGAYFSIIYSPEKPVQNPAIFTCAAAVAVCQTLEELYGIETAIKWVNDIFSDGKKITGILTEGITNFESGIIEAVVVGIGINVRSVNSSELPENVAEVAGSVEGALKSAGKKLNSVSRNELIAKVTARLFEFYEKMEKSPAEEISYVMNLYRERSFLIGKEVSVNPVAGLDGQSYNALVTGIDDSGSLTVRLDDGTIKTLGSGEVSLRSKNLIRAI